MSCPSQLQCSMYADGALPERDAALLEGHVASCTECRALIAVLVRERHVLEAALRHEAPVRIPAFRGARHSGMLAAAALLIVLASGSLAAAGLLDGVPLPRPLEWLTALLPAAAADVLIDLLLLLATEGSVMLESAIETAGTLVLLALLLSTAFVALRRRPGAAAMLSIALAAIVSATPAQALEIRRSEGALSVPAGETIDDTLIALGDSIEIDGTVTGDLIAFGRRVVVRGVVQGQLVTAAESVNVEGDVGGSVLGAARALELANATVGRNLYGFGQTVLVRDSAGVGGNAIVFGTRAELAGPVATDVIGFAAEAELGSTVGGDVLAYASALRLLATARIEGDVVAHVPNEEAVVVSPNATIGGSVETVIEEFAGPDARPGPGIGGFIFGQLLRFAAAFVTGLIVLWLVPSLRRMGFDAGGEAVVAAGVGLVALVAVPIIAVMTAITLIGFPIALFALTLWLAALYFAKILLAHFIGKVLFERVGRSVHFALRLLVGLLVVLIVVNLPFVGGVLNFLLTITGFGMLLIYFWGRIQGRNHNGFDEPAPA